MEPEKDYTGYSFKLTLTVLLLLVGLSALPRIGVGKKILRKVNILSEIVSNDHLYDGEGDLYFDTTFLGAIPEVPDVEEDTVMAAMPVEQVQTWAMNAPKPRETPVADISDLDMSKVVGIEDFSESGKALARFYRALDNANDSKSVRVAVLGDSFIEGDIFTADLREQLQDFYGGGGVGFVPFGSVVAKYRPTVTQTFDKWKNYDIGKKNRPEELNDKFFISGVLSVPEEGAFTTIKGTTYRKHVKTVSTARLLFINEGEAVVKVTVNDSLTQTFTPPRSASVQQITLNGDIGSIDVRISNPAGFTGYGVILEDEGGVQVDNYSVRGNSGLALYEANYNINRQINAITGYDLIILQYGLNVMSPDVLHYDSYGKGLANVIRYIQKCFPEADILVMGVGDRSTMKDGDFATMPSIAGMIRAQRSAAQATGVAFWNTFQGMGGENSMVRFVEWNWAAKDYTHISFAGGRYIAHELVKALVKDKMDMPATAEPHETDPEADTLSAGEAVTGTAADTVDGASAAAPDPVPHTDTLTVPAEVPHAVPEKATQAEEDVNGNN